jgi:hypothetical protein
MAFGKQGSHAKAPTSGAIMPKASGGKVVGGGGVAISKAPKTVGANKGK